MRLYLIVYEMSGDDLDQLVIAANAADALALWATAWEIDEDDRKNAQVFEIKPANVSQFERARVLEWHGGEDVIRHRAEARA